MGFRWCRIGGGVILLGNLIRNIYIGMILLGNMIVGFYIGLTFLGNFIGSG